MAALHHGSADALGPVTPTSDDAPAGCTAQGVKGQGAANTRDCAQADAQRKRIATLEARAALVGLVLAPLDGGAWRLNYSAFGDAGHIATLPSLQAAEAMVYRCEHEHAEMAALAVDVGVLASPDFNALRIRLERAGWTLTRADGQPARFYASRWGHVRELQDLDAVRAFADRVGAPA